MDCINFVGENNLCQEQEAELHFGLKSKNLLPARLGSLHTELLAIAIQKMGRIPILSNDR